MMSTRMKYQTRRITSFFCMAVLSTLSNDALSAESDCGPTAWPAARAGTGPVIPQPMAAQLAACVDIALGLSKANKYAEATAMIGAIERAEPNSLAAHLARARIEWDGLNWIEALRAYDRVLALDPANVTAQEGRLLVLSKMNLPGKALEQAKAIPGTSTALLQRLHEDETALAIRWSEKVYYAKPGEQFPVLDRAIAMAETNLKRYPQSERSRFDYVRALNNRQRSAEAIAAYEQLQRDHFTIPAYVNQSAGSAYLAMKRPEQAAQAFRAALASDPDDIGANLGLFYALIDLSDFPAAQRQIDAYVQHNNLPPDKFDATMAAIMERAFENRLDVAQAKLQLLSDEAPSSEPLRLAQAKIALWRGWPRQAQEQANRVTLRQADDLHANILLADTDAVLGDYASAETRLARLHALVPGDPDVNNLLRAARVRAMYEIALSVSGSRSKENLGNGHGMIVDMRAFGHPINTQLRPFVHTYFERTRNENESADYRRLGAGVDYTLARFGSLRAELQQEFFRTKKTSLLLSSETNLDDFWSLTALLDSNSVEVPLRARLEGIFGNQLQFGVNYRLSERLSFSANVTRLRMSDGNLRQGAGLRAHANLIEGPYYKGTLEAGLTSTSNNLTDASYFNPARSNTTEVAWINEWMNYQRYTRSFSQQLVLSVGRTAEAGYAAGTIGGVNYGQRITLGDTLSVNYGVGWVRRLYSGLFSSGPEANLSVNWKF